MSDNLRYSLTEKWSVTDTDTPGAMLFIFDSGKKLWGTRQELGRRIDDREFCFALGYTSSPWYRYQHEWDWATATTIADQQRQYRPRVEVIQVTKRFPGWVVAVIILGFLCLLAAILPD